MAKQSKHDADAEGESRSLYPLYGTKKSFSIGAAVAELGGARAGVQKSLIAQRLGVDDSSAMLTQSIGSAKAFGIICGRGVYKLTDIGIRYFFPESDADKRQAQLAALKMPIIFEKLIDRFDGSRVPSADMLVNIIRRDHEVTESWQPRLASLFLTSLRDADLIDGAGFLRYRASLHGAGTGNMQGMSTATQQQPVQQEPPPMAASVTTPLTRSVDSRTTSWNYKGLRVETPEPLTMDLWKRLSDYINVLRPEQEKANDPGASGSMQ